MRLLHLMHDEKFIDDTIDLFEACNSGNNTYLLGIPDAGYNLKYTRSPKVTTEVFLSDGYNRHLTQNGYDALIIHGITTKKNQALQQVKHPVPIVWILYGAEFYITRYAKQELLQARTRQLVQRLGPDSLSQQVKQLGKKVLAITGLRSDGKDLFRETVSRVTHCAATIPEEFELFKASMPFFEARYVPFTLLSLELLFKEQLHRQFPLRNGIFIGNSNSPSSNHVDVLHKLHALPVKDRDIIVPLSYGEGARYKQAVIDTGNALFGAHFKPVTAFMSKEQYVEEVLCACNIAILNHERQQGFGNVVLLLWMGAKLFLSENNVIYPYLKRLGLIVYSVQQDLTPEGIAGGLTDEQKAHNRQILLNEYSTEAVQRQVKKMIEDIKEATR